MKKYLMTGMAALAFCAAFTSCSKEVAPYSEEEKTNVEVSKLNHNYEVAFQKTFGKPAAGHTWGFSQTPASSKASTRTASPNANLWGAEWNVPARLTDKQKTAVRLYFQYNNEPDGMSVDYKNFFVQDVYKGATNPLNNGTAEKAAYSTEEYDFNGTMEAGSAHMDKLTAGSDDDHIANYNNATCSTNNEVTYPNVYVDGWTPLTAYDDPNWKVKNQNNLKFHSDEIQLMENSKTDCFGWHETQGSIQHDDKYVIIDGSTIQTWATNNNIEIDVPLTGRQFVGFDYEAQVDMEQVYARDGQGNIIYYDEGIPYLKVETNMYAHTIVPANTPGAYPIKDRYVDNDQSKGNLWAKVGCADGYYSDWIVCITEGIKLDVKSPDLRVMAEDLSSEDASDFDFNDVVFDVYFSPNVGEAYVMVQAAGGTLPLTIHGTEVHGLFGQDTKTMINTHAEDLNKKGISNLEPKRITLTGITVNSASDVNTKVHIYVTKEVKVDGQTKTIDVELVNSGEAACKIGVSPSCRIADEREDVRNVVNMNQWVTGGQLWPTYPQNN